MFPHDFFQAVGAIPILMLGLSFHMNFFPIFKGMENSNDRKITKSSLAGLIFCSAIYIIVGLFGYRLFGDKIDANLLLNIKYD